MSRWCRSARERFASPRSRFIKDNLFLFVLLILPALLAGRSGGVAWETHLGGILFGLFIVPRFLPQTFPRAPVEEIST